MGAYPGRNEVMNMDDVRIHTQSSRQATWIPNYFIDDYMCEASGEFVKVYIYLLRCLSDHRMGLSLPAIADRLDITEKDVARALKYWEKQQLVKLEYNTAGQLTGICLLDRNANSSHTGLSLSRQNISVSSEGTSETVTGAAMDFEDSEDRPNYSPEQIASFKEDEAISDMFFAVSTYMKHMLNSKETNAILYWLDGLGFTPELIEYLVEYCMDRNHNSIYYMDKVAMNWASEGIQTVEAAKESANMHSKSYYAVCNAFGITGRNLNERELSYIKRWTGEFGFTIDIITEACQRTIANINKPNFEYAHRILKDWHDKGVHTLNDVVPLDSAHAARAKSKQTAAQPAKPNNRFHQFSQGDYDMDALESALIRNN